MTSGQTAGMGVPQIRLETKKICMYAGNKVQTSMTQNDFEILAFPLELQINSFSSLPDKLQLAYFLDCRKNRFLGK